MREQLITAFAAALLTQLPAFHAETRLVVIHATVQNSRGELVTTLDRDAFTVYENGKRQPIRLFTRDDLPVSLGLVIDNSGSMRSARARVEAAALALVDASNPRDETFVVNFADAAHVDVPFTSDATVLRTGIARVDSIGGTALFDAIGLAEDYVKRGTHDRKVLVVITDGRDNGSVTSLRAIEETAERYGIALFAVRLSSANGSHDDSRDLEHLAERTGGATYEARELDRVGAVALEIARQIRSQYTIGYAPINQRLDGTYRSIKLSVSGTERLVTHTRQGYLASPP